MNRETKEAREEVVRFLMNEDVSEPELRVILTNLIHTAVDSLKKEE